ncbi:MAG TPA: aspartate carbamoyltransferase catalytic subunit [Acidimicrobiia bacterium]|nr:aspartate carbamoyltransferase catalytic subunit [Acidimicrobiia bacterium]
MRHLLSIEDVTAGEITDLLDLADGFVDVLARDVPKVPTLRGRTIALLFYESSTRTRLSFDRAAKALSADVLTFSPGGSSVSKGESLKDTALTLQAMGPDLMVVRHGATGAPWRVADWTGLPVVNAGDGSHQHPTQALLDVLTLRRHFGAVAGLSVAIVGDIRHSRVARSTAGALIALDASVTLVAPRTLLPVDVTDWGVATADSLDEVLDTVDVVYLLRIQTERGGGDVFPSVSEYVGRFGLTRARAARLRPTAMVMHPGPMNRGVEIDATVADGPRALVAAQVSNGIAVRMAVLFRLLGSEVAA